MMRSVSFDEILGVMKELAKDGNEFFQDAIKEYEIADDWEKGRMKEWLEGEFLNFDDSLVSVKNALLIMQYE